MKTQFPLTLDQALRKVLPETKHCDRLALFRQFIRETYHVAVGPETWPIPDSWPKATDAEIEECIKQRRRGWYSEARFDVFQRLFNNWRPNYSARLLGERGQAGARARWAPPKKIPLTPLRRPKKRNKH